MLQRLIEWSARHAMVVALMAIGALVAVGSMLPRLPVDVFPELNAPTVVIMAEAGGLAAEDVERAVVFPIEVAVQGLPDLRRLRSASSTSLGIVWVEFEWGTDLHRARQLVAERLSAAVDDLPAGVHAEIAPITSITGEVMLVSLASPDGSVAGLELRSLAEHDLRPRLLSVGGVAQVVPIGGELAQYQVRVAPDRLRAFGVTMGRWSRRRGMRRPPRRRVCWPMWTGWSCRSASSRVWAAWMTFVQSWWRSEARR